MCQGIVDDLPHCGGQTDTCPSSSGAPCSFLQFNAGGGYGPYKANPAVGEHIGQSVVALRPNLVTLNETCEEQRTALMGYLENKYPMNMVATVTRPPFQVENRTCSNFGNAILVRGTVSQTPNVTSLPGIVGEDETRKVTCATGQVGAISPWVCGTHLLPGDTNTLREIRKRQIDGVADAVNPLVGGPVIMAGDFNTTPREQTPTGVNNYTPMMLDPIYDSEGGSGDFQEVAGTRTYCDPPRADPALQPPSSPCGTYDSTAR